jgi:hypothetical protein
MLYEVAVGCVQPAKGAAGSAERPDSSLAWCCRKRPDDINGVRVAVSIQRVSYITYPPQSHDDAVHCHGTMRPSSAV